VFLSFLNRSFADHTGFCGEKISSAPEARNVYNQTGKKHPQLRQERYVWLRMSLLTELRWFLDTICYKHCAPLALANRQPTKSSVIGSFEVEAGKG